MSQRPDRYPHAVRDEEGDVRQASRVVSGLGSFDRLGRLVAEQGATRTLVLSDSGLDHAGILGEAVASLRSCGLDVSVHSDVPANPALASIAEAVRAVRDSGADQVVALGGGSVLDASKAVALL
ncbi:MAG: iron-containing alcohol dehydrogenase, partial [Nocardioidaceae bacterium]